MKRIVVKSIKNYLHDYFELEDYLSTDSWRDSQWKERVPLATIFQELSQIDYQEEVGLIEQAIDLISLNQLIDAVGSPLVVFQYIDSQTVRLILIVQKRKNKYQNETVCWSIDGESGTMNPLEIDTLDTSTLLTVGQVKTRFEYYPNAAEPLDDAYVYTFSAYTLSPLVGLGIEDDTAKTTPFQKLIKLLKADKKEIYYIYFYAVLSGLISVLLPLSMQAIVNYVSGGEIINVIVILITAVIIGTVVAGILQIVQMTLVEVLQRRIFTKTAFEYAYRLPRITDEALYKYYPPELVNRFFDVINIQKSLPKVLIDLTANTLQIVFGLMLLSFYHPFFVAFGLILMLILFLIFRILGPKGLKTSLAESDYKYQLVHWLQEIAKSMHSFKVAGFTNLPINKTDFLVRNYLNARTKHFNILRFQYGSMVVFKVLIISTLLIFGTVLVTERTISLGQFLASEIVIILLLGAVEKLIMTLDVVYDILTAAEKVSKVTNLPIEQSGNLFLNTHSDKGIHLKISKLSLQLPYKKEPTFTKINLELQPNESVWIQSSDFDKLEGFSRVLQGFYRYEGIIKADNLPLHEINLTNWRDVLSANYHHNELFEGTIEENISVGKSHIGLKDVFVAVEKSNLADWIYQLPQGLQTPILAGGKGLSENICTKIMLARSISERPRLLIFNTQLIKNLTQTDQNDILNHIFDPNSHCSIILLTDNETIGQRCQKTISID